MILVSYVSTKIELLKQKAKNPLLNIKNLYGIQQIWLKYHRNKLYNFSFLFFQAKMSSEHHGGVMHKGNQSFLFKLINIKTNIVLQIVNKTWAAIFQLFRDYVLMIFVLANWGKYFSAEVKFENFSVHDELPWSWQYSTIKIFVCFSKTFEDLLTQYNYIT